MLRPPNCSRSSASRHRRTCRSVRRIPGFRGRRDDRVRGSGPPSVAFPVHTRHAYCPRSA
jgi:hypothetical protein